MDDWCSEANLKHIDFIWMDVQGAESDVIAGGRHTLSNTRFAHGVEGDVLLRNTSL
nr:FkbM family methyltransferase [Bradyrhizobium retamae]